MKGLIVILAVIGLLFVLGFGSSDPVCHESAVVPSTATHGIGSTIVCVGR